MNTCAKFHAFITLRAILALFNTKHLYQLTICIYQAGNCRCVWHQERGDLEAFGRDIAAVELVPASQREGGATLGSVVNHTYTDGKDNDLIHWLPHQLAHNLEKRSTLMKLEAVVSEYIASNEWR